MQKSHYMLYLHYLCCHETNNLQLHIMKKKSYNPFNEKEKYTPPFAEIIRCKGATLLDGSATGVKYGEDGDAGGYIGEDDIEDYGEC